MTLGEQLRNKYSLTSLRAKGAPSVLLAINEVLEISAQIADEENSPAAASRIRSLKWVDLARIMSAPVRHGILTAKSA
jgi:hypothetical protein